MINSIQTVWAVEGGLKGVERSDVFASPPASDGFQIELLSYLVTKLQRWKKENENKSLIWSYLYWSHTLTRTVAVCDDNTHKVLLYPQKLIFKLILLSTAMKFRFLYFPKTLFITVSLSRKSIGKFLILILSFDVRYQFHSIQVYKLRHFLLI